ncbi:protein mono-ADP-ribosyltransferase PARP10 [Ammospiza nelsoni]|uniref:protein mono-ADP-ribosyltransferase PARP10 n=1 Tax=Ammospiza nelsoni TaxID=2857394 RepID=UPI002869D8AD|nr:protein mono-ADP-ribosyltransferase PARP10 [Ammospiza nelsoni]
MGLGGSRAIGGSRSGWPGGVLEVRGVPPDAPEELLVLYFESRRRSGGGPVQSCQRLGPLLFLTFEDPQDGVWGFPVPLGWAEGFPALLGALVSGAVPSGVAGVLGEPPVTLPSLLRRTERVGPRQPQARGGPSWGCARPPPWDPSHLLLRGLEPGTPPEHLGTLLGVSPGTVTLCQGSVPGWSLLRLQEPLSPPELASAEQRARRQGLALLRVPRSPAVRVRALGTVLGRDLLELYFENRRSDGGRVSDVRVLPGGHGAIVTFQEPAGGHIALSVERVGEVGMVPLVWNGVVRNGVITGAQGAALCHQLPVPLSPQPQSGCCRGHTACRTRCWSSLPTFPSWSCWRRTRTCPRTLSLLRTEPLLLTRSPCWSGSPCWTQIARRTQCQPQTLLWHTRIPHRTQRQRQQCQRHTRGRGSPPATFPSRDKDTKGLRAVPSQAQPPRPVSVVVPEPVSAVSVQDEALVPAEPGAVRYLQQHYQDVLSSVPEVSLLPLEGGDISGFRVSGELGRCQAMADFLQSLLDSVASHPTTLHFPGVARFLRDPAGQSLLQQLESRFQCVIQLDSEPWSPPDPQLELEELLPPSREPWPRSWHQDLPEGHNAATDGDGDGGDHGFHSSAEEIKELLAALRPSDADGRGSPGPWPDTLPGDEWDPNAAFICAAGGDGAKELLSDPGVEEEEEEEVQMALAIQFSMDHARHEQEELARATALSLSSYSREQEQEQAQEDASLLAAREASLEEALLAVDTARVTLFCSSEQDASAVARELERALAGRLRAQDVASERLRALPAAGRCALALLRCRHTVQLSLRGDTATLRGFAEYTALAAQELALLLHRLPPPGHGATADPTATAAAAHWVRWDPSGTAVPYAPEAAALLEQAWSRQERRLDLVLDGRPFTVDLERMEEFDIGSAHAVPICRSQPPLDSAFFLLGPEVAGLEEEVRLMVLAEDSEEFADTVRHFCSTLEELHSQISIVQVQKLIHPVLYKQYQLKKGSVKRACAAGTVVERVLFHGTTKASSCEICLHGFNRSFCGKNATLYGRGVYFAVRAAISARDRYSPPSAGGTKFIFMAKVLTGEFTAGRRGLRAPPPREGSGAPQRYHSVVDDPRQPDIFVIFNDTQAYPQYLITCRSRHGGPL